MGDRITHIDAIRGFALFGILVVNILVFSSVYYGSGFLPPAGRTGLDLVLAFMVSAVFELKFYLLFSFLFGYSVTLQMLLAEKAGAAFWLLMAYFQWIAPARDDSVLFQAQAEATVAAFRGTPQAVVAQHLLGLWSFLPLLLLQAPCALAMFLLGFVSGQRRLLERREGYEAHLNPALRWGLLIGLPCGLVYAAATQFMPGSYLETAALAISILTAPLFTLALMAAMLKLFASDRIGRLRDALANAGRKALSNYLLQSVFCAAIFHGYGYGYGFGPMGRLSMVQTRTVALVIFAIQLVASSRWLRRFRYGPLEWLLRAMTIGHWPQLRIAVQDGT